MDNYVRNHMEAWLCQAILHDEIDRARAILEKADADDPEMFENRSYMTTLEHNGFFDQKED